ncbi:MAG: SGNH/GDSL hydrolase family protein [Bacteroidota bacterium]|nr:SGNH/GDSL hydrolase family protein [Bacteroidota bacterium]
MQFLKYGCYGLIFLLFTSFKLPMPKPINYLPLGDSYTICTGAIAEASWPKILMKHLNEKGIKTNLLENPARNGFSTQNLIDKELPLLKTLKPNFVTLLIGVNDWVREVPKTTFEKNLKYIIDEVQKQLPDKSKLILITIPDFGVTPQGKNYGNGRNISNGIAEFNEIILTEGKKRNIQVVDIFMLSKKMKEDTSLVAADGLHPSAKEYAEWEKLILPVAEKLLKEW